MAPYPVDEVVELQHLARLGADADLVHVVVRVGRLYRDLPDERRLLALRCQHLQSDLNVVVRQALRRVVQLAHVALLGRDRRGRQAGVPEGQRAGQRLAGRQLRRGARGRADVGCVA